MVVWSQICIAIFSNTQGGLIMALISLRSNHRIRDEHRMKQRHSHIEIAYFTSLQRINLTVPVNYDTAHQS